MPKQPSKNTNTVTKYQRFEAITIHRGQVKNAPYNPRVIDDYAKKKLRESLKNPRIGLVETLVWNKQTGNLVGGHQRLSQLDALEKGEDYSLTVSQIDVDLKTEKEINVLLNNPNLQGNYEIDLLKDLCKEIDFETAGFDTAEINTMFGDDFSLEIDGIDGRESETVKKDVEEINKIKQKTKDREKEFKEKQVQLNSPEHFLIIVFQSPKEVDSFLKRLKLPLSEKYISSKKFEYLLEGKHRKAEAAL